MKNLSQAFALSAAWAILSVGFLVFAILLVLLQPFQGFSFLVAALEIIQAIVSLYICKLFFELGESQS